MGGARFMGTDTGIPCTPQLKAFQNFLFWILTGWILTFGLSMLFIKPPNFVIPTLSYIFIGGILFWKYQKLDNEKERN